MIEISNITISGFSEMATSNIEIFSTDGPINAHDVIYKGFVIVNKVIFFEHLLNFN